MAHDDDDDLPPPPPEGEEDTDKDNGETAGAMADVEWGCRGGRW